METLEQQQLSPLEAFVRDYVDVTGGVWEAVEPQVYDLLLPGDEAGEQSDLAGREILRITFDPEAVPEHPQSQLASYGTPLIDRLLADAVERGRFARAYVIGLNVSPHGLPGRVRRALHLPESLALEIERVRPMQFPQAVFWFEATFVSDQKEYQILPEAIDLHYGRQVRHLEQLLDPSRLAPDPELLLAEAPHINLFQAYPQARAEAARTLGALANTRRRDLSERLDRQVARMNRYYDDLRSELNEQLTRSREPQEDQSAKLASRRETLDREQRLRVAELRSKSSLHVELKLLNLLIVEQPKLLVKSAVTSTGSSPRRRIASLDLVWDPLLETLEAAACPRCDRPTFVFTLDRLSHLTCPNCPPSVSGRK